MSSLDEIDMDISTISLITKTLGREHVADIFAKLIEKKAMSPTELVFELRLHPNQVDTALDELLSMGWIMRQERERPEGRGPFVFYTPTPEGIRGWEVISELARVKLE